MADRSQWGPTLDWRMKRRHVLLAGGSAAFLAACGGDDKDKPAGQATTGPSGTQAAAGTAAAGTAAAAGQPRQGGTLRQPMVGVSSGDPPTLYPYENLTYLAQIPGTFHYSRLLRSISGKDVAPEDHTKLEGDAAAKLPEQPDPLTYIFKLKPNVVFHDKPPVNGRKATAQDWAKNWDAFQAKSQNAAGFKGVIDKVEAVDAETVKFTLKAPFAPFLVTHMSTTEGLWLIPPETIDNGQVQTDPVGTGPWVFRQWEKGVALRWDRNPKWHDGPMPYFAKTEQSVNNDAQRIISALQAGELDVSGLDGPFYDEAKKKLDPKGQDTFFANQVSSGFYFNFDNKPWGDKRVRQALSMALDRDGYLRVQDQTKKGDWMSHISPAMAPYFMSPLKAKAEFGPNAKYFEKNIAEAKKLMEAAGVGSGITFKLRANVDRYGPAAKQAWELFANTITEAGFKAELVYEEYGAYIQSTFLGKIPEGAAVGPFIGAPRDPDDILMRLYWSESPRHNWGGTPIPEMAQLDAMFVKQRTLLNLQERISYMKEIQRAMAESMLVIPYHATAGYAYSNPYLNNYNWKNGYGYPTESSAKAWFSEERIKKG
jgi:peptide/nickel transport system substrate-binding protein